MRMRTAVVNIFQLPTVHGLCVYGVVAQGSWWLGGALAFTTAPHLRTHPCTHRALN